MDKDSAVLVADFAENYDHHAQDEVQTHHGAHEATTLHPVIAIVKNQDGIIKRHAIDLVSNDRKHDTFAATLFLNHAISLLRIKYPNNKRVYIFSDGAASQYKGKTAFYNFSQFAVHVEVMWNFFGSRHGKGPSDGESAVVKSAVMRAVKAGATISTPREFYQHCSVHLERNDPTFCRSMLYLAKSVIDDARALTSPTLVAIKGTRSIHSVIPSGMPGLLATKLLSCFCERCLDHQPAECSNRDITGSWQEHSVTAKCK